MDEKLEALFSDLLNLMSKNAERLKVLVPYWNDYGHDYHPDLEEKFYSSKIKLKEGEDLIDELLPKVTELLEKGEENEPTIFERKIILNFARKYYPPKFCKIPKWAVELPDQAELVIEGEGIDFFRYCLEPKEIIMYDALFYEFHSKLLQFQDFTTLCEGMDFVDNLFLIHKGFHNDDDFEYDFDIAGFIEYKLKLAQKLVDNKEIEKAKQILIKKVIEVFEYRSSRIIDVNKLLTKIVDHLFDLVKSSLQYNKEFIKILKEILKKYE